MKTTFATLAIAFSAIAAGSAANATTTDVVFPHLTRAQVQAELNAARAAGTIQQGEETLVLPSMSTRARADVLAELSAAVAAGTIQQGEETYVPVSASTQSRAAVKADLAAWHAAGLADEWSGQQTPDIYSTAYRIKHVAYERTFSNGRSLASQSTSHITSAL